MQHTTLVPTLLSVLGALSTTQDPPRHAARVCAAAVAALNNMYNGILAHNYATEFHSRLLSDHSACSAIVRWGLACPEAADSLPPDQAVFIPRCRTSLVLKAATRPGHPFWSPLTCCMSFMTSMASTTRDAQRLPPSIKAAIDAAMVDRVVMVAAEHPYGAIPCLPVGLPACMPACPHGPSEATEMTRPFGRSQVWEITVRTSQLGRVAHTRLK
jgi:hypothetical protein